MPDLRMPDINRVTIAGTLTRDPEFQTIGSGTSLCKLSLANNRKYTTKSGEKKEDTVYLSCTCWGGTADFVNQHMKKGYPVIVEGRMTMSEWVTKEGDKRIRHEVSVEKIHQLTWNNSTLPKNEPEEDGADIPF